MNTAKRRETSMVKQKDDVGVFRHAESKSGTSSGLALLPHGVWSVFPSTHHGSFAGFPQNAKFLCKTRSSEFSKYY